MANYGNYFPATYMSNYYPQVAQPQQMTPTNNVPSTYQPQVAQPQSAINWVQGIAGAKAFFVPPNSSALLMDSESDTFFLKSSDASGMPSLRIFQYTEIVNMPQEENNSAVKYVTMDEFNEFKKDMIKTIKESKVDEDAKYAV